MPKRFSRVFKKTSPRISPERNESVAAWKALILLASPFKSFEMLARNLVFIPTAATGFATATGFVTATGFATATGFVTATGFATATGFVTATGFATATGFVAATGFTDAAALGAGGLEFRKLKKPPGAESFDADITGADTVALVVTAGAGIFLANGTTCCCLAGGGVEFKNPNTPPEGAGADFTTGGGVSTFTTTGAVLAGA